MTTTTEDVTGTSDQEYKVIWFTEACLKNAQRWRRYIKDAQQAGNAELIDFFQKAQAESRKGAELGETFADHVCHRPLSEAAGGGDPVRSLRLSAWCRLVSGECGSGTGTGRRSWHTCVWTGRV